VVVLILERVPPSLRGELSRWLIEPRAGVFIGKTSALVRDKLWERTCQKAKDGAAMLLYSAPNEQGFAVRSFGDTSRTLVDWEGLTLVRIPKPTEEVDEVDVAAPPE
jgi:CRISPR-associated protein Cas2